jgi:hypothetical protein
MVMKYAGGQKYEYVVRAHRKGAIEVKAAQVASCLALVLQVKKGEEHPESGCGETEGVSASRCMLFWVAVAYIIAVNLGIPGRRPSIRRNRSWQKGEYDEQIRRGNSSQADGCWRHSGCACG